MSLARGEFEAGDDPMRMILAILRASPHTAYSLGYLQGALLDTWGAELSNQNLQDILNDLESHG